MKTEDLIKYSDDIITVLSEINNKIEIFNFVRDLLSETEILEFSRRFEVAKLLSEKVSYTKIEEKTGMSSTTIARISKFLKGNNK
jgi:TrpR-related protein YerC/YecD